MVIITAFITFWYIFKVYDIIISSMTNKIIILFYQVDASLEDAGGYFQHTGESINVLLVNNFAEMEEVRMVMLIAIMII